MRLRGIQDRRRNLELFASGRDKVEAVERLEKYRAVQMQEVEKRRREEDGDDPVGSPEFSP